MKRGFLIMIAEDDGNDLALLKHTIAEAAVKARLPITIQSTNDGVEAISYLSGEGKFANRKDYPFPDIVILDLKMPRLSGLDVLRWLKNHDEYTRIPKIMLSGSGEDRDVQEAYRLGVNTYFQKPNGLDEFRELIYHLVCYWSHTKRSAIKDAAPC